VKKQLVLVFLGSVLVMMGCAKSHFGIADKAMILPPDVAQTEEAIASAEKSSGAKYCPDKITQSKDLAKQAMETYWACHTAKAMEMLAQARKLATDAKACQPPPPPAPPSPRPPAPAPIVVPPARQPVSFHSVYFSLNKSDLTAAAKTELDKAAKILKDNPDEVLELQGNTCALGSEAYNKKLGDRRAKSVLDYLTSKGISADRLKTVSFGLAKPVAPNTTEENRAKNRRVDLVILK
jgi:outer membrane protein OmpA-like peptidoglycan-associated protein